MKGIQLLCSMDLNILIKILLNLWLLQSYNNPDSVESVLLVQNPEIQINGARDKLIHMWRQDYTVEERQSLQ